MLVKTLLKRIIPGFMIKSLVSIRWRLRKRFLRKRFEGLTAKQSFTKIYDDKVWGTDANGSEKFNSGSGSRESEVVQCYIESIQQFIESLDHKPDMVDLGCGDFYVGAQLRPLCGKYVACDIVDSLIQFDRSRYANLNVEFKVCNIIEDELPDGEVVTLRQVLQHLSNAQIAQILSKIKAKYKYLLLTEHLPSGPFTPNIDKEVGPLIRLDDNNPSGVVITEPPFQFSYRESRELCKVAQGEGIIVTTLYRIC